MLKYSRQRECIKDNLNNRFDHPTAEMVYDDIRKEYPNVSLGTVYRNLTLLADLGEIMKIPTGSGPDRFDGNVSPHCHFLCKKCGKVSDLSLDIQPRIVREASKKFTGVIDSSQVSFFGTCPECEQ